MKRIGAILLILACMSLLVLIFVETDRTNIHANQLSALKQSYIVVSSQEPVPVPRLITTDGDVLAPERLRGHWSVIFFGFRACPLVCPRTLAVFSAVARNPESGVSSAMTQLIFVSIDPEHDTPSNIHNYLQNFGGSVLGLTGSRDAVDHFSEDVGAGSQPIGTSIDHSTSLFVLDPKGRLAGILLRPSDPARVVADLKVLRHLRKDPFEVIER